MPSAFGGGEVRLAVGGAFGVGAVRLAVGALWCWGKCNLDSATYLRKVMQIIMELLLPTTCPAGSQTPSGTHFNARLKWVPDSGWGISWHPF